MQRWGEMREQQGEEEVRQRQQQQLSQFYNTLPHQKVIYIEHINNNSNSYHSSTTHSHTVPFKERNVPNGKERGAQPCCCQVEEFSGNLLWRVIFLRTCQYSHVNLSVCLCCQVEEFFGNLLWRVVFLRTCQSSPVNLSVLSLLPGGQVVGKRA